MRIKGEHTWLWSDEDHVVCKKRTRPPNDRHHSIFTFQNSLKLEKLCVTLDFSECDPTFPMGNRHVLLFVGVWVDIRR